VVEAVRPSRKAGELVLLLPLEIEGKQPLLARTLAFSNTLSDYYSRSFSQ
jgi:hypothetical protein